jgi:hypothetical protein
MKVSRMKKLAVFLITILCAVTPCASQDAASAKAFMDSAFQLYQHKGHGISGKILENRFIHSSLLALVKEDFKIVAAAGTDEPYAGDYDFICDCQEYDGIWNLHMDIKVVSPELAYVTASFKLFDPKIPPNTDARTIQYTLVPEQGQWKIYDYLLIIPAADGISFRKGLQKDIVFYSNPPKP